MTQQCHWFIHVRPGHKVLLYFEEFEVEGKPEGESDIFFGSGPADPPLQEGSHYSKHS